jgi:hypothetical protein
MYALRLMCSTQTDGTPVRARPPKQGIARIGFVADMWIDRLKR